MDPFSIPRAAIGLGLRAAKLPFHVAGSLLRPSRADVERERADALRDAARAQAQIAEEEREREQQQARSRREQAAQREREKKQQAVEEEQAKKRRAAQAEQRRKQAAEKAAAQREQAIDAKAKRDQFEALEAEKAALDEREVALTTADEADRLEEAAARAKGRRKGA
jgi:colicin import membrane protein